MGSNAGAGRRPEIVLVCTAALVQGLALVTFPAASGVFTSPSFHDLSGSQYGSLFLPMVMAAIVASTMGGPLARRKGLKLVLLAGLGFDLLSMGSLAASELAIGTPHLAYVTLLGATTALGLGFGAALTALNALAAGYFPDRPARAVTALHALLGTGTALAPLLIALLTGLGAWWALPAAIAAVLVVLVAVGMRLPLSPGAATAASGPRPHVGLFGTVRMPGLFVAAGILYGILETIYANWAVIYLREDAGVSIRESGYALAAFWAMVTVGRLAVALGGRWLSPARIYPLLPCLMVVAFLWIASVNGALEGIGAFALAGLACSAFLPVTIGFAQAYHHDHSEIVSGGMIAAYMLGFGIGSFGLGPLRDAAGIPLSVLYGSSSVLALGLAGTAIVLVRRGPAGLDGP
ncbi:MAG: MFS transporter [Vicinamibacterales bacterium]|nr:MFS transporter [Vicinamibacterales bacterium]